MKFLEMQIWSVHKVSPVLTYDLMKGFSMITISRLIPSDTIALRFQTSDTDSKKPGHLSNLISFNLQLSTTDKINKIHSTILQYIIIN